MANLTVKTFWFLTACVLVTGSVAAQQTDVMELQNGSAESGSVKGLTVTHYVFQTNQETNEVPHERVKNIRYWDVTKPLGRLEQAFQNRRYQRVVQFGEQVRQQVEDGDLRNIHLPRVLYFLATAHFRQGNLGRAVKLAKTGLSEPGHVWFDRLVRIRLLGEAYQAYNPEEEVTDDTYEAISDLGKDLIALAKEDVQAPDKMVDYIRLLRLQALEELGEGKLPITRVRYKNLKELSDSVLQERKFLGRRRCLIRQKKNLQDVVKDLERKLQDTEGSMLLQSGKQLADGVHQLQKWTEQEDDSGLIHGAISSIAKAQAVYDPSSEMYTIQHRQTLLHSMELYRAIASSSSDEAQTTFFSRQAKEAQKELESRYPGSPEAQKAGVLIQN